MELKQYSLTRVFSPKIMWFKYQNLSVAHYKYWCRSLICTVYKNSNNYLQGTGGHLASQQIPPPP